MLQCILKPKDERLCTLKIKDRFRNIPVISLYAPTEEAEDYEKDKFYETLE